MDRNITIKITKKQFKKLRKAANKNKRPYPEQPSKLWSDETLMKWIKTQIKSGLKMYVAESVSELMDELDAVAMG